MLSPHFFDLALDNTIYFVIRCKPHKEVWNGCTVKARVVGCMRAGCHKG